LIPGQFLLVENIGGGEGRNRTADAEIFSLSDHLMIAEEINKHPLVLCPHMCPLLFC